MKTHTILLAIAAALVSCTQNPVAIISNTANGETIVLNTGGSVMTKSKAESGSITHGNTTLTYTRTDKDETVIPSKALSTKANVETARILAPAAIDGVKAVIR